MTIKTQIVKSRTGLFAIWFDLPYKSNMLYFVGGYLSEDSARKAADGFAEAIGRTVELQA